MPSTLVKYESREFWMHNAVGEVWLCSLKEKMCPDSTPDELLNQFSSEIDTALSAGWVTGPLQHDSDSLLSEPGRKHQFILVLNEVLEELLTAAKSSPIVRISSYAAAAEFLVPELNMLRKHFTEPSSVPSPAHIYVLGKGWVVA